MVFLSKKPSETFSPLRPKVGERETRSEMAIMSKPDKKPIETYEHKDKQRLNNPPVGLVTLGMASLPFQPGPHERIGNKAKRFWSLKHVLRELSCAAGLYSRSQTAFGQSG